VIVSAEISEAVKCRWFLLLADVYVTTS